MENKYIIVRNASNSELNKGLLKSGVLQVKKPNGETKALELIEIADGLYSVSVDGCLSGDKITCQALSVQPKGLFIESVEDYVLTTDDIPSIIPLRIGSSIINMVGVNYEQATGNLEMNIDNLYESAIFYLVFGSEHIGKTCKIQFAMLPTGSVATYKASDEEYPLAVGEVYEHIVTEINGVYKIQVYPINITDGVRDEVKAIIKVLK